MDFFLYPRLAESREVAQSRDPHRTSSYDSEDFSGSGDSSGSEDLKSLDQEYYDVETSGSETDPFTGVVAPSGGILGPATGKVVPRTRPSTTS